MNIYTSIKIFFIILLIINELIYIISKKNNNNYNFNYLINKTNISKIRIGILASSIKNGGVERQTTLILNYFNKVKIFELFLFTIKDKEKDEYLIDDNIERLVIKEDELINVLKEKKLDIFIYQFYKIEQMNELKNLQNTKTIFINRSCFLHWIYYELYNTYESVYKEYKNSKYVISLIPFENDYLFKKWGINSILMNNFIPYDVNSIKPSTLTSNTILMIGRGEDPIKRFDLGILAMKYIIEEIPKSEMKIISDINKINHLEKLVYNLSLNNNIEFVGYLRNPEIYYENASLHFFPSLAEAFPNILSETLSYGIPNILFGLDYVSTSKEGTVIIYDDSPLTIAKEAIKLLKSERKRKILSNRGRRNMKKFRNDLLLKKWIKIILSIYNGGNNYEKIRNQNKPINENEAIKIIENQLKLLKLRIKKFENITINNIENFTFMENIK